MSPAVFVAVALAGGLGGCCRLVIDGLVRSRLGGDLPWGIALLNVSGSFFLGVLAGAAATTVPADAQHIVGTGFLGGYTTFSSAAVDVVRLHRQGRERAAVGMLFGVFAAATVAAAVGWWLGGQAL